MNTHKLILAAAFVASWGLCSCTYRVDVISEQNTPVRSTVTPVVPLFVESGSETIKLSYGISSKPVSSEAPAISELSKTSDELLSEGYVLQFSSVGLMLAKESFSLVAGQALKPHLITGLGQNIYVVTNCGKLDLSSVKDLASFQSFTYPADLIKTEDDIPLVGFAQGVNIEADENGLGKLSYKDGSSVTIAMKQIASKINLSYSFNVEDLTLSTVSIVDAPSSIPLLPPVADGILTFYPEAIMDSNFKMETVEIEDTGTKTGNISWFISDNIRGAVSSSSTLSEQDKNSATAPTKSTFVCFEAYSSKDDNTYKFSFYPGDDVTQDFNIRRGNIYLMDVSIASKDPLQDKRITVVEPKIIDPPVIEEHNYADPANCYIVKPGDKVIIGYRAGADGGANPYTEKAVVKDAVIVWQTKEADQLALGNNSDALELAYDEEYGDDLLIVTTNAEGNALVAVRDAVGNILWSWHIWVTDYNPNETNLEYNNSIWMDRSLGSLNRKRGEKRVEGWLYQWGRKDPFPPIDYLELLEEGSIHHAIVLYDGQGVVLPDVDTSEGDKQVAKMDVGISDSNLDYSIAHPLTFIYNPVASESNTNSACIHWISSKHTAEATSMALWSGDVKTAFDPCPAGWIISSTNYFSTDPPKHNSLTYTANAISSYASAENPQERGAYLNVLDNQTVWVPFQGYRRCTKNGATVNCGDVAVFWTGYNQDDYRTWTMKFRAADLRTMVTYPRSNGLCVRCVKINK